MNVSQTSKIGKHATLAWTMAGLLSASSLVMSQTTVASGVQITGNKTSVMPKSNATRDMLKAASAAAPAAQEGASFGNGPAPGPRANPGPGCNLFPAPASTGADVPITYFGPPPSSTNPSLVGPYQLLQSGVVDSIKGTITLPLYKGYMKKGNVPVWYILTDTDDPGVAALLGLNLSAKLSNAGPGARTANFNSNSDLIFDAGTVNFAPNRLLVAGPPSAPFPPIVSKPGSIGDANYSPIVRVLNAGGIFYNAPIVAYGVNESQINFPDGNVDYSKVHDQVLAIDPYNMTVTFQLINGFSFGHPLWYISTDASTTLVAAIEGNTYAPLLDKLKTGNDDSFGSAIERIFIATNGSLGCANPQRQGLDAALTDGFRPNNTFGGIPTVATDYSPLWNGQLYEWTPAAVDQGYRQQLREEFQILTYVDDGLLTGPNGAPFGDSMFIISCPPVQRLE
jgi:hypothetical protein